MIAVTVDEVTDDGVQGLGGSLGRVRAGGKKAGKSWRGEKVERKVVFFLWLGQ